MEIIFSFFNLEIISMIGNLLYVKGVRVRAMGIFIILEIVITCCYADVADYGKQSI